MKHQIEVIVSRFKYICDFKVTSPCAQHLWDVKDEAELLDYVKAGFSLINRQVAIYYIEDKTKYITSCRTFDYKGCEEQFGLLEET